MAIRTAALALLLVMSAGNTDGTFNAAGYRTAHYRAPVNRAPEGAPGISTAQAAEIWRSRGAVFIDVLPVEGGVVDPDTGQWRLAQPHISIPGAYWFPGAGAGELAPATERWFRRGVARRANGRKGRTVIVFCKADCWLSWNAARRLASWGYRDVRWFGEGVDGWRDAALPLGSVHPQIISATSDSR